MRRSHSVAVVGCVVLVPYSILLCGGRSLLAERVAALEAVVNEQLVVVDANGTPIGALADVPVSTGEFSGPGNVVLDLDGLPLLPVHVVRDHILGTDHFVWFAFDDCSGPPLFPDGGPLLLPRTMVFDEGGTLFYSDVGTDPQDTVVGSYRDLGSNVVACEDTGTNLSRSVLPGFRASLQPFIPPYAVVTRGELAAQ